MGIAVPHRDGACPEAVAVIIFTLSLRMVMVSILSVAAIPLGMGITINITGSLVILLKGGTLKGIGGGHSVRFAVSRRIVEIGGAGILFLFGTVLFLAQL